MCYIYHCFSDLQNTIQSSFLLGVMMQLIFMLTSLFCCVGGFGFCFFFGGGLGGGFWGCFGLGFWGFV